MTPGETRVTFFEMMMKNEVLFLESNKYRKAQNIVGFSFL